MDGGSVDTGCHNFSENILFVWSKRSVEKMLDVTLCDDGQTQGRNVKIGLESAKQYLQKVCSSNTTSMQLNWSPIQ